LPVKGAHRFAPRAALCAAAPAWALVAALAAQGSAAAQNAPSLFDLSIEELGDLRVTSVSRRPEAQREAAASVYVITAEDIRRSGVTTIADALRLAPGVEVARNSSNEWTISIRGFSSDLSNKLLVLIDGRSVYSPLFAGVFWDVQDTLLADIDRIEVVSGPLPRRRWAPSRSSWPATKRS
jgi:iron complex outermembrane receptor protein